MSDAGRGLPLLSGPPPPTDSSHAEIACRKCGKEFNMIFSRARKCNHCGYSYCHSCSDYQALMPRPGPEQGYDPMHVCAFCIEYLTITAAGKQQLKQMSLAKLKKYIQAYNIKAGTVVEKDDLIDAILAARGPNGCLPPANENYYRKYSVPNKTPSARPRNFFSSRPQPGPSTNPPPPPPRPGPAPEFPRPDLAPDHPPPPHAPRPQYAPPPQQQYNPPPHPPPRPHSAYANTNTSNANTQPSGSYYQQYHTSPPQPPRPPQGVPGGYGAGYPGQAGHYYQGAAPPPPPHYSRPQTQPQPQYNYTPRPPPRPSTQRPTANQAPQPPPRPRTVSTTPPPTLDQLLTMDSDAIGSLSISALKDILFKNHVASGQVLEKGDLVRKVLTLVETERLERERHRQAEEREEMERVQREMERREREQREREQREAAATGSTTTEGSSIQGQQQQHEAAPAVESMSTEPEPAPAPTPDNTTTSAESATTASAEGPESHRTPPPPTSSPKPASMPAPAPPKAYASPSTLERSGLCVICQDEEANIAIVDCGHLAMCRGCSDLVMSSTRECPLCRTRIVTEARLLRIYKT